MLPSIAITFLLLIGAIYASLPPKLADFVPKKSQNIDTKLKIYCQAQEGTKPFRFAWSKNGQPLVASAKTNYRIETTEEDSLLVIDRLVTSDSASYSCQVQNSHGTASQITVVTVKGGDFATIRHILILSRCVAHIFSYHHKCSITFINTLCSH